MSNMYWWHKWYSHIHHSLRPIFFQIYFNPSEVYKLNIVTTSWLCCKYTYSDMYPYCGNFQLHIQFWSCDQTMHYLFLLALDTYYHFKFEFRCKIYKKNQSEDSPPLQVITYILSIMCLVKHMNDKHFLSSCSPLLVTCVFLTSIF